MADTTAAIVHQLPGRVRLRLNERRGDAGYFSALAEDVSRLDGVDRVKVNAATASMVIEYSDTAEGLMQALRQHALSIERPPETAVPSSRGGTVAPGRRDAAPFHIVSNRGIDPMFMLGTLCVAVGAVQVFRGRIMVPAVAFLWYAMDAFQRSRGRHDMQEGAGEH